MKRNYLKEYLAIAPTSLALVRAIECRLLSDLEFKHPMLDVGCGDGLFASLFFGKNSIEEGIDLLPEHIESAKKQNVYKNLQVANVLSLPYEDESFNTVFSNCVLEHIPQIDDALCEISRVMKRDGKLIYTVPTDSFGGNLFFATLLNKIGFVKLGEMYSNKFNSLCYHCNLHDINKWEEMMEKAGLELLDYKRYLSPSATKIHDIMVIFSVPAMINKKLFGKMILFPSIRKLITVPVLSIFLNNIYKKDSKDTSSLLIICRKKWCQ